MNGPAGTVLLVDDDLDILEALDMVLEGAGYRVLTAHNGCEALRLLRAGSQRPFVIVLDLMMPDMDGWRFRAEQSADPALASVPVLVLSGARNLAERAASLGCTHFLEKPVDVSILLSEIELVGACKKPDTGPVSYS